MLYNALNSMKAKKLGAGKFSDGQGLWLHKRNRSRGKWVLLYFLHSKRREMGLGVWPDVTLADARQFAADARKLVRQGVDPIQARREKSHRAKRLTVAEAIQSCFEAKQAELKNEGSAGRWLSSLSNHVIPKIGQEPIEVLDQHMLKAVIEPIWHTKPEAARKAVNRINLTLKHAAALGLDVDLQATMKLRALLGKQRHTVKHIPSLLYKDAPAFYKMLCTKNNPSSYALRFLILTVVRSGEVRFASHDELEKNIWIIPPDRTKTNREHRVPLTKEALKVMKAARASEEQVFLFPSSTGRALSDVAMSKFMKDMGYNERPHGFRATFRTWVEEMTNAEYEVKEAVLGHVVDSGVVRAYQRSDRFKKRKNLLQQWEGYLLR